MPASEDLLNEDQHSVAKPVMTDVVLVPLLPTLPTFMCTTPALPPSSISPAFTHSLSVALLLTSIPIIHGVYHQTETYYLLHQTLEPMNIKYVPTKGRIGKEIYFNILIMNNRTSRSLLLHTSTDLTITYSGNSTHFRCCTSLLRHTIVPHAIWMHHTLGSLLMRAIAAQ